ncbi:MAG: adenylosuccinate lyase [Bacteroidales bacterium]|nr:adenylosuccinate lyase [Bacteroidales bacterium]
MSDLNTLTAVSPVDGRYRDKTDCLAPYFSEFGLIKYRVHVEVEYFIALCKMSLPGLGKISKEQISGLRKLVSDFSIADAEKIKEFEKTTNHDVKAVEYFLKEKFIGLNLKDYSEFVHFGLTSQDINNTAVPLSLKDAVSKEFFPLFDKLIVKLSALADDWADVAMLARTHGQPASPTRLGKEIMVFVERLQKQYGMLQLVPYSAKFGGATGNFNAHVVAYPETDWVQFADTFVNHVLGLERSKTTTQIEHYDNLAGFCDGMKRINNILIDLSRDIWTYVSIEYFKQKIVKNEVGSSAMPHKVNPIDFENAEGNLGMANAIYEHLAAKLPISRMQRDLTDSTVLRNIGMPLAHSIIAIKSIVKGLDKLIINKAVIDSDLSKNWLVVSEGIQTILRREGYPKPYETLKELTRTTAIIDENAIKDFIMQLDISEEVKKELLAINPFNYTGIY